MKYFKYCFFLLFSLQLSSQLTVEVDNDHISFTDNFIATELSHWTPLNLEFFVPDLTRESTFSGSTLRFVNTSTSQTTFLENGVLKFQEIGGSPFPEDKMSLTKDELRFINGASWTALSSMIDGAGAGKIDINNSSGANRVRINVLSDRGTIRTYGSDGSLNAGIESFNGSNRGYIYVSPTGFTAEAGMYINNVDEGIIFADVKNFRVRHPHKSNTEIWYASLEGPEVAAYDRGSARLENGEAFVPFQDHFKIIANTDKMTVSLTPMEWDTYGLAVIEKTSEGFRVKELKGGKGNFEFDWEVKCIRKGKEKYQVVRERDVNLDPSPSRN